MQNPEFSVVIPVFNEAEGVEALVGALVPVLESLKMKFEVIFVDDGSTDKTVERLGALHMIDPRLKVVIFSRNFGKEIALAAGMRFASGKAVLTMDADLQHPPEAIPDLVAKWKEGYEMIYGVRSDRQGDGAKRQFFTRLFYKVFSKIGEMPLQENAGDFRLMDKKVVDALNAMSERARFNKGLFSWVGFKSIGVPYQSRERFSGTSRFAFSKLFTFALDGVISFSTVPLRVATYLGVLVSIIALVSAAYFLMRTLFFGTDVPGFPSLMVSMMFFSGLQLVFLGIIGEYIGRIFEEVKRRPLFVVRESIGLHDGAKTLGGYVQVGKQR